MDRGFLTANDARPARKSTAVSASRADAGGFSASPWSYNGKIFAMSEDGDTFVIQAGPEFKLLGGTRSRR